MGDWSAYPASLQEERKVIVKRILSHTLSPVRLANWQGRRLPKRVRQEEMPSLVVLSIGKGSNRKVSKVLSGSIVFWSTPARRQSSQWLSSNATHPVFQGRYMKP